MIFSPDGWQQAKALVSADDRVFFVQDACYLLNMDLASPSALLYARAADVNARNLAPADHIELLDDTQWVQLTEHATNVLSW